MKIPKRYKNSPCVEIADLRIFTSSFNKGVKVITKVKELERKRKSFYLVGKVKMSKRYVYWCRVGVAEWPETYSQR